jgi:hypothetical protein
MGAPSTEIAAQEHIEDLQNITVGNHPHPTGSGEAADAEFNAGKELGGLKGGVLPTNATPDALRGYNQTQPTVNPDHVRPYASNPERQVIAGSNPARGPLPQDLHKSTGSFETTKIVPLVPQAAPHGLGSFSDGSSSPGHGVTHIQPPEDEEGHHQTPGSVVPVTGIDKMDPEHGKLGDPRLASYPGTQSVIATAQGDPHTATGQRVKPVEAPETPGSDAGQSPHQFSPTGEHDTKDSVTK